jgi:hypothetical protein
LETSQLKCNKCQKKYDKEEYRVYGYSKKNGAPLYDKRCKKCLAQRSKKYREKNPDKIKKYNDWWQKNKSQEYLEKNKERIKEYNKTYREENKEKLLERDRLYYEENKEKRLEGDKKWREDNKGYVEEYRKKYYQENKESILEKKKDYYQNNQEGILEKKKEYYEDNQEELKKKFKKYSKENRSKINERMSIYVKDRKEKDLLFKFRLNVRDLITKSIKKKGYTKKSKTHEILGIDYKSFKKYIENQFYDGMSWENRDEWDLDHIIPIASGENEEEILALNHYTNLQPLFRYENLIKGGEYDENDKKNFLEWYSKNIKPISHY